MLSKALGGTMDCSRCYRAKEAVLWPHMPLIDKVGRSFAYLVVTVIIFALSDFYWSIENITSSLHVLKREH